MLNRWRNYFHRNNTATIFFKSDAPFFLLATVKRYDQIDMIEQVIHTRFIITRIDRTTFLLKMCRRKQLVISRTNSNEKTYSVWMMSNQTSHRKPCATELTIIFQRIAPRHRHIVNDPVMLVIQTHSFLQNHQSFVTFGVASFVGTGASLWIRIEMFWY